MIIICCFIDCAAATVLCYEQPEAGILLRKPRDTTKDRLVDWPLILQSYGFIGLIKCLSSFAISYWNLQRNDIPFSTLCSGFGGVSAGITEDKYAARLAEASSIYFINLVIIQWFNLKAVRTRRLPIFQHPPRFGKDKTTGMTNEQLGVVPGDRLRGGFLALRAEAAANTRHEWYRLSTSSCPRRLDSVCCFRKGLIQDSRRYAQSVGG